MKPMPTMLVLGAGARYLFDHGEALEVREHVVAVAQHHQVAGGRARDLAGQVLRAGRGAEGERGTGGGQCEEGGGEGLEHRSVSFLFENATRLRVRLSPHG
ncbi:hypothetical protein [Variovorax sp.]|uniref:hypothetical protein n=1 Tax=Variovorax sp. TaxID=1871043 RepID=UPI0025CED4C7|nr:hypothetical protein [Variovorax sp.]